jgi:hypothetical protein
MKAEEFIDYCDSLNETAQFKDYLLSTKQFERTKFLMEKFAEYHVKQALKEAVHNMKDGYVTEEDEEDILNCYPLTNIK